MSHAVQDEISLEIGCRTAARLRERPDLLEVAWENLRNWSCRNSDSPSLLRCYAEWQTLLSGSLDEICGLLCAETEEAQRLRQNSPFAGVLSPAEVWAIKAESRRRHEKIGA